MELKFLTEPLLQFGKGACEDPKLGIRTFHPYDVDSLRPEKIKLGIIGKPDSIDKVINWINSCKSQIVAKTSKNPHPKLFPSFPGFSLQEAFKSEVVTEESYIRKINNSEFEDIIENIDSLEKRIEAIAKLYLAEIKFLSKNKNPDVILCVLSEKFITSITEPEPILSEDEIEENNEADENKEASEEISPDSEKEDEQEIDEEEISEKEQNFRRYLKAKAMEYNIPIQIARDRIHKPTSDMQDPATIAWNFFTALYYKASGTPWAMIRKEASAVTCYAGISFFKSRDKSTIQTSVAQIFNELGNGIILRGEPIDVHKDDRTPHLSEEQAFKLLDQALNEYHEALKIFPKRLVLHKSSNYNENEITGFKKVAKKYRIESMDMVTIQKTNIRLYREEQYPPRRGTLLSLDEKIHLLYTRGSVEYYETYPGKYVPTPIEVRLFSYDESPDLICHEILALSKMNWNNTQFDRKFPITIECARNVGEILKYLEEGEKMQLKYSFYM